ncbi:MAG: DUF4332 domain-containing protein [Bernardetiaceae bacterium]
MNYKIEEIEGIGPATAEKLALAEITNTNELLEKCATANGRKAVAETTGLSTKQVLVFANMADLMRIKGVGGEFAELLKASGVDTIKELRNRNATNLAQKMAEVNAEKKLTRRVPTESQVAAFIEGAKTLEPLITY